MSFGGGSGTSSISGSTDVVLNSPANNQVLGYNTTLAKWQNQNLSSVYVSKDSLFVNVRDHGAVGDGISDDTASVQSAIDGIPAGGCVYFPPGVYLTGTLTVYGATSLMGAGGRVSTLKLKSNVNASLIQTPDDGVQRYGLNIRQLGLDGQASLQTSGAVPLISIRGMNESTYSDLYILNPRGSAMAFGQATVGMYTTVPLLDRIVIRGDVASSQSHGIFFDSGSSDALVSQCDIGFFSAGAGICFSGHNGATISNCNSWQTLYGYQWFQSNRARVIGCLADYAKHHGFVCQESSDMMFDSCQSREYGVTTTDTYDGFRFEGVAGTPANDISLMGCRAMSTRGRVGVSLQNDLAHVRVIGGSMNGQNVATSVVGSNISDYRFLAVAGIADIAV